MTDTDIRSFLAEHPKLIGALFMTMLLLSSVGSASAILVAHGGP